MRIKHGSLSSQEFKRLQGGDLILNGYDNEEISDIVGVSIWDETGLSLSPIRGTTWAEVGKPAV